MRKKIRKLLCYSLKCKLEQGVEGKVEAHVWKDTRMVASQSFRLRITGSCKFLFHIARKLSHHSFCIFLSGSGSQ